MNTINIRAKHEPLLLKLERYYSVCYDGKAIFEERYHHVLGVLELCCSCVKNDSGNKIDHDKLIVSAILHDIAKPRFDNFKRHNDPESVGKALEDASIEIPDLGYIAEIIRCHRGKEFNPGKFPLEAAILRMCDKIDNVRRKESYKAAKKREDSYKLICSFLEDEGLSVELELFKGIFKALL